MRVANFSPSLYAFPLDSKSICLLTASRKLSCPLTILAKVGELESSETSEHDDAISKHRSQFTFEIRHERLGTTVERVDNHLAVSWAGDFYPSVLETGSWWSTVPRRLSAYMRSFGREIERNASIVCALGILASDEERLPGGLEGTVESSEELESLLGKDNGLGLFGGL